MAIALRYGSVGTMAFTALGALAEFRIRWVMGLV
jgi:hypothetical protein